MASAEPSEEGPVQASDEPTPEPPPTPEPAAAAAGDHADSVPSTAAAKFSASAAEFVPGASAWQSPTSRQEVDNHVLLNLLPRSSREQLRGSFWNSNGYRVSYYLGTLKSYNVKNGYGFLECPQARSDYKADVFIHKNLVPNPWTIKQPCEFAVVLNSRGQPQALDVLWLPPLNSPAPSMPSRLAADSSVLPAQRERAQQLASLGAASSPSSLPLALQEMALAVPTRTTGAVPTGPGADAAAGGSNPAASSQPARGPAPPLQSELRRLGTLKSYSPAQGYGFIACEEIYDLHRRDVYFDKAQLPTNRWEQGQWLEFTVVLNARNQPQARGINWTPFPLLVESEQEERGPRYSQKTLDHLRVLLQYLANDDPEHAFLHAIDTQGRENPEAGEKGEVDYVAFVLDRLGREADIIPRIKDFVRTVLMLMLAKTLPKHTTEARCSQFIRWFEALAEAIQPGDDNKLRNYFHDIVEKVKTHITKAIKENALLQDDAHARSLNAALNTLQAKVGTLQAAGTGSETA